MKRIALHCSALALVLGVFVRCDTSDCGDCDEDYEGCRRSCVGFVECSRCEEAYDACLDTCDNSNVNCDNNDPEPEPGPPVPHAAPLVSAHERGSSGETL